MSRLEEFRSGTRAWLEENCPPSMRTPMVQDEIVWGGRRAEFRNPDGKLWLERMAAQGWTCPTWPAEYGGGGLSPDEAAILRQELARINARPALTSFGISFLLFDMASAGVSTRPIALISGASPFCETFFDDGWTIAKRLLQHERTMISGFGLSRGQSDRGGTTATATATRHAMDSERRPPPRLRRTMSRADGLTR